MSSAIRAFMRFRKSDPLKLMWTGGASLLVLAGFAIGGDNWPQWRGPALNGTTDSTGLPQSWSEKENVKWKAPLPSWSGASPILWGERIFVTSPSAAGTGPEARTAKGGMGKRKPEGEDLLLLCISKKDGKELWRTKLAGGNYQIGKQNMSTPSPITDGKSVWVLTGTGVLSALDMEGKILWQQELQKLYGAFGLNWGYGASPLLFDDSIVVPVLHGMTTDDPSYVVAFDPKDGKVKWKVERPTEALAESPDSYCTPVPLAGRDRSEILILGGDYLTGHESKTGKEIWRCAGVNPRGSKSARSVASPVVVDGLVLACVKRGPVIAVKAGGQGVISGTHIAWTSDAGFDVPTPVSDGKLLYIVEDGGLMSCLDVKTGEARYKKERLPRGTYSASPILGDGKIYAISESGRTVVVAAGPEFKILSENPLDDDYTLSSIAVSGSELFIRTSTHLYCIGK